MAHLERDGRIVTLSSGMTRNWAVDGAAYAGAKATIEQFTRSLSREVGRLGTPEDIADVVSFLASERARWITGQLLVANGGSTP